MTKEDNEDFENSTKCSICENGDVDNDVKVGDHCHISEQYRDSGHRDCNINLNLNHEIHVLFYKLKNYDSHLIMQELSIFSLKISLISNGFEKCMSFTINNKLSFIDSFKFINFLSKKFR